MNNIFNFNRFGRLFIKHTVEHYKSYLMSLGVLIGVLALGVGFYTYVIDDQPMNKAVQNGLFAIVLWLSGTIFTSNIFADMGDKKTAVPALTLPASHFEKFLVGWIYSYVIFQIVFLAIFPTIIGLILNTRHWPMRVEVFNSLHEPGVGWILLIFAMMHGAAICGAIFFKKLHFIKTAFVFFIGLMVLTLINKPIVETLLGINITAAIPFAQVNFFEGQTFYSILPLTGIEVLFYSLTSALALLLWAAAYLRLTEKQV